MPTPSSPPTVTASRITPDETPVAAVYRFDVSGATFQLGTPYADQIVIPPLIVQGSVDGTNWTELGTLVPATAPTIVPGGNGYELQVGPATFWWENPTGQPAYQHTSGRVRFGWAAVGGGDAGGLGGPVAADQRQRSRGRRHHQQRRSRRRSTPVSTRPRCRCRCSATMAAAAAAPRCRSMIRAISGSTTATTNTNTLVTNLFPTGVGADLSTFIGVSPYAGAYPNNGSAGGGGQSTTFDGFHYVATTSTHRPKHHRLLGDRLEPAGDQPKHRGARHRRSPRRATRPRRPMASRWPGVPTSPPASACSPRSPPTPAPVPSCRRCTWTRPAASRSGSSRRPRRRLRCPACRCSTLPGAPEHLLASAPLTVSAHVGDAQRHVGVPANRPCGHQLGDTRHPRPRRRHPRPVQAVMNRCGTRPLSFVMSAALVVALLVSPVAALRRLPRVDAAGPVSGAIGLGGGLSGSVDERTGLFSVSVPVVSVAGPGSAGVTWSLVWDQGRAVDGCGPVGVRGGVVVGGVVHRSGDPGARCIRPTAGPTPAGGTYPSGLVNYPLQDLEFRRDSGGSAFELSYDDGRVDGFDDNGNLVARTDRFGNRTQFTWEAMGRGQVAPTSITDGYGLTTTFTYTRDATVINRWRCRPRPARTGCVATTTITLDDQRRVTSVTDPSGATARFEYAPVSGSTVPSC